MSEPNGLMQRIERVGASIDPNLTDRDVERLVEGARRRRRRRAIRRVGLGAVGVGVAAAVLAMGPWGRPLEERRTPAGVATVPAPAGAAPLRLADGSVATPLDDTSALVVREDGPERVAIDLSRGRGRFEVAPRPERLFSVHAGDVTVTVIGTIFTVERVADRIGVTVSRGKVLVEWAVGSRTLGAGEARTFHFVLSTGQAKDNRIPPKGFRINEAAARASVPVALGAADPGLFTAAEYAGGYDDVSLTLPPGADVVSVRLFYQTTSREYIEFLRDEISGAATSLVTAKAIRSSTAAMREPT